MWEVLYKEPMSTSDTLSLFLTYKPHTSASEIQQKSKRKDLEMRTPQLVGLLSVALLPQALARSNMVPSNVREFYNGLIRNKTCTDKLASGFQSTEQGAKSESLHTNKPLYELADMLAPLFSSEHSLLLLRRPLGRPQRRLPPGQQGAARRHGRRLRRGTPERKRERRPLPPDVAPVEPDRLSRYRAKLR